MPNLAKISVALTSEMNELVLKAVESGEYATSSEVIRDALREWNQRRELRERGLAEMRQFVDAGMASGPGRYASMDEIKQEGRRRLKAPTAKPD